jgi:small-conductance mechanosensitive channel
VGLLYRQIDKAKARASTWKITQYVPWIVDIFPVLRSVMLPLPIWILGNIAIGIFQNLKWANDLLVWFVPFFALWLLYRFLRALITLRLKPNQARIWGDQILRPVFVLIIILQTVGLLDDFLDISIRPSDDILITLRSLLSGLIIFYIFFVVSRYARTFLKETLLPRTGIDPALNHVIATLTSYTLTVMGLLIALSTIGINLTTLTVVLGGLSVGIGFGLQELINNFISGFVLLFERTISPGDIVEVEDLIGTVEDIGMRSMQVRTIDNIQLIVPNGRFVSNVVTNFTRSDKKIRTPIRVVTSYRDDPHKVQQLMLDAAQHPDVLESPAPRVFLSDFGERGIQFTLQIWIEEPLKSGLIKSDIRLKIWDLFGTNGISIPYPQQDVTIRSDRPFELDE